MDRWIDLLAARYDLPRIVLLRQLRTAAHLGAAVARVVVASEVAGSGYQPGVGYRVAGSGGPAPDTQYLTPETPTTGYLEVQTSSTDALKAFETDAPHAARAQQSEVERARLDRQTDTILALLKQDQST